MTPPVRVRMQMSELRIENAMVGCLDEFRKFKWKRQRPETKGEGENPEH